jgi:hypothetical protein
MILACLLVLVRLFAPAHAQDEPAAFDEDVANEEPERVAVGVHLNDLQTVDLQTHTYVVDFWIWFRWHDPDLDPASSMEFVNPSELWGHMLTPNYEEPEELPDGSLYQVVRVQGKFSKKLPLYNYPYDRQVLEVLFEDSVGDATELVYVPDTTPITVNPGLLLPGYVLGTPRFDVVSHRHPTTFGDLRAELSSDYSRGRIEIPLARPALPYTAKLLLPVVCVVLCASLMFLLMPAYVDARVDVGITALLTVVALQITSNQDLPDVGYLMLMDKVYLLSYGFVLFGLVTVVRTARLVAEHHDDRAALLQRRALDALAAAYAVALAGLVALAVQGG